MRKHVFENTGPLDLAATLDCGQAFRWAPCASINAEMTGDAHETFEAVVEGDLTRVWRSGDGATVVECESLGRDFWHDYFALDIDYDALHAEFRKDATLAKCLDFAPGIRVLRQPFFETLISFIISQNNNIPRIKGIIDRLSGLELATDRPAVCDGGASGKRALPFPTAKQLAPLTVEDLAPLRSGYRAPAILDAARRVASGELNEAELRAAPFDEARKKLLAVYGVGPKIADCVLLFGLGRFEAFPIDVWMRRAMAALFPDGLPEAAKPYGGIAQQYIFHYARSTGIN